MTPSLYMIFHRICKIAVRPQLVAGHIACRSCKQVQDPVYDGGTGMLYGGRLYYMEFCIRLAAYTPMLEPIKFSHSELIGNDHS